MFGHTLVTTLMCIINLQSHEHLIVTIIHGLFTDFQSLQKTKE